jgi:hypothetical protein
MNGSSHIQHLLYGANFPEKVNEVLFNMKMLTVIGIIHVLSMVYPP